MEVKVAILNDNIAGPPSFRAEHGLSVWVEVEGRPFLWDCGQTDITVRNARSLGLDLRSLQGIGLSHGHYDHTSGLLPILEASGPKRVFTHPMCFAPRYFKAGEIQRFIGIPYSPSAIEGMASELVLSREPVEVMPQVRMTGEVPRSTVFEVSEPNLFCLEDGELFPDPFLDDQALVIGTPEGAVVLTGCAHAGLVNILSYVLRDHKRIRALIGGTHLGLGDKRRIGPTLNFLDQLEVRKMIFNHCTGIAVISLLMDRFKDRFVPGHTGLVTTV